MLWFSYKEEGLEENTWRKKGTEKEMEGGKAAKEDGEGSQTTERARRSKSGKCFREKRGTTAHPVHSAARVYTGQCTITRTENLFSRAGN